VTASVASAASVAQLVAELAQRSPEEQRQGLLAWGERLEPAVVDALCAEVARQVGVDVDRAAALAGTARWLAEHLDDPRARARSARAAANAAHFSGDSEGAQELYEAAIQGFQAMGEAREEAITRSSALLNLGYLGSYHRVERWAAVAREIFEGLGDRLRLAILDHNFAGTLYRQDRWEEALERYTFAYREFLKLEQAQDVAICLRNIAVCHISLHNFTEALEVYQQSRAYCAEQGLSRLVMEVDYNIAYLYYLRGEYTRAIQLFRDARKRCREEGDEYHMALCDLDQAEIYLELNLVEEAVALAQSARDHFGRLGMPYEAAKALTNKAIAVSRQGHGDIALKALLEARGIFIQENNQLWPALIDFYRAVVLYRQRRPQEAIDLVSSARRTFAALARAPRAAMCELLLAELYLEVGAPNRAREACQAALERLSRLELPALEHQAYLVLGKVEEAVGDLEHALDAYHQSHMWLEKLRSQLQGEDLKIAFLEDKLMVYESLVWLTMKEANGHDPGPRNRAAFDYIEKAKSRSLTDLMSFRAHELAPKAPANDQLAGRVRTLREELNWFYHQIDLRQMRPEGGADKAVDQLRSTARAKEDELLRGLRELQATDQEFSSLQSGSMVDLETVRSSLAPDAVLAEYFIARGTVFVCVVDRERLEVRPLTTAARARELHRLLQFQISQCTLRPEHAATVLPLIEGAIRAHLRELYDELIRPVRAQLGTGHLVVVPHGFLHHVPFHALHDGEAYLVDGLSISYAPSAGVFHLCATKETTCDDASLVLGVADERAPHILEEVKAVAESLPNATLLTGDEASEDALQEHAERCRFVHIATHGLFRRDNPIFSAIQLGTSRLSLFDLYNLRLNAELVVLSGCGTGLNAVRGADELVGLTRGLLYAGAQSVVVTLWDVNDASTALFMRGFYRHLAAGVQRAEALRRAMQDLRQNYPNPCYWAPFVLVGKPA